MAFAKLKAHLRARAIRTIDALWQAIGQICDLFEPVECRNTSPPQARRETRSFLRASRTATDAPLCANDDETKTCREFTLEGIGQTSSGYAPNQRQQGPCSSRR